MKVLFVLFLAIASACAFSLRSDGESFSILPVMDAFYPEGRITNGKPVSITDYPYQAGLSVNGGWCGASVISNNYILTAAHCVIGLSVSQIKVYLGSATRASTSGTGIAVTPTKVIVHANYKASTLVNDIALLQIPSVSFGSTINKVSLAPASAGTYAGNTGFATGWGKLASGSISSTLQGVDLSIISNTDCAKSFGSTITTGNICVATTNGKSICQGDSGGPLTVNGVQVGITSFTSSSGCLSGIPAGFTRVSAFRSWITTNSGV